MTEIVKCRDCGKELSEEDLRSTDPTRCDSCETQAAYDRTSADVVLPLMQPEAEAIADALELLAGIDEGEHTDRDELLRLAAIVRAGIEADMDGGLIEEIAVENQNLSQEWSQ